jgi:hypothetical protein
MVTFTVKIAGNEVTAKDIKEAVWQCTDLSREEISVEYEMPGYKETLKALDKLSF